MQFLLCAVSENQNEGEPNTSVQTEQGPAKKAKLATLSVIPDKDRKRSYRLSSKRRQCRLDNEALASRTYNLTLDVNNLKQQVRYLQECRDLYVTRLAVARQHAEGEAVGMVTRLFRLFCHETCGTNEEQPDDRQLFLSRVHARLTDASAGGRDGIPLFMQTWRNFKLLFTHRSYTVKSIRLVSHVGAHDCEDHSASICASDVVMDEARQRCGPSGGCVVESAGAFTGRLKRDAIAAIYPKLLQDEELVTRLIGRKFSCSLRLKAYFNARGQLVDHVAEFDVLGALNEVILSTNR
ncbi:hypothetical protein PHYSODRAFT_502884 [Phytophthora sojae]|uniref:Uncharacterized protein n=1 Tax=Phytophthora sojae (strain P6497) TaxID=1094619 RepID=G4ZID0_PHYSP|nr:hypothetical protein PHYSODRAFT_502884 [Phytophthora sojae]EGZ18766.1 hypothetical protein PHYSODRAFT_502884 [Phytophthora sojae]|eukprot:XP_009527824.1 hypothetical protein PHYSODRAFT_502884 [Phytophthora sojae]